MLAFSIVLHTVRLIRGELTFCHKLLRRFCRGTKPCGFNSPVGLIRIYAPK